MRSRRVATACGRVAVKAGPGDDAGMRDPSTSSDAGADGECATTATVCRGWFDAAPVEAGPLASSGFSGSRVLRVRFAADAGSFVLKSFHAGTSRDHAEWVHRLAMHLRNCGIEQVPEVMTARAGGTVVVDATGTLWELCRLVTGVSVPRPTAAQAAAAGELLARLHLAAAKLPGTPPRSAPSPGILRRIEQARRLEALPWAVRRDVRQRGRGPRSPLVAAVEGRFDVAIARFTAASGGRFVRRVARLRPEPLDLQPVLRDVWCEHVLHASASAAKVNGVVDLHAAGIDLPATDIARLLGSWGVSGGCGPALPLERQPEAAEAYERVRPLAAMERRLVGLLHCTAVLFGLDNWFRWTLDEGRSFADTRAVVGRIDRLLEDLEPALRANDDCFASLGGERP